MPRERYYDQVKSHCELWKAQWYDVLCYKGMFHIRYKKRIHRVCQILMYCTMNINQVGPKSIGAGMEVRKLVTESKLEFCKNFNNSTILSLRAVAIQLNAYHRIRRNISKKELKMLPYKVRNLFSPRDGDRRLRLKFFEYRREQLFSCLRFLERRFNFRMNAYYSLLDE